MTGIPDIRRSEMEAKKYTIELDGVRHELTRKEARALVNSIIAKLNETEDYLSLKAGDTIYYVDTEEGYVEEGKIFSIHIKGEKVDEFFVEFPESNDFDGFDGKALGKTFFIDKSCAEDALKGC